MAVEISFKKYLQAGLKREAFKDEEQLLVASYIVRPETHFPDYQNWATTEAYLRALPVSSEILHAAKTLFQKWKAAQ